MENLLAQKEADSIENEISSKKLQCVSCFIQGLSEEAESHIKKAVKAFNTPGRIAHGKARASEMRTMNMYRKVGATREQSSRSSASSAFEPVPIPPDASRRERKQEHRDVLRLMFLEQQKYRETIGYSRQTGSPGDRTFGGTWKEQSNVYGDLEMLENVGDQYLGINWIKDNGTDLLFFNWSTKTNSGKNAQSITVLNASTKEVTTKGYALCDDIGAHNLCLLPPDVSYLAEISMASKGIHPSEANLGQTLHGLTIGGIQCSSLSREITQARLKDGRNAYVLMV